MIGDFDGSEFARLLSEAYETIPLFQNTPPSVSIRTGPSSTASTLYPIDCPPTNPFSISYRPATVHSAPVSNPPATNPFDHPLPVSSAATVGARHRFSSGDVSAVRVYSRWTSTAALFGTLKVYYQTKPKAQLKFSDMDMSEKAELLRKLELLRKIYEEGRLEEIKRICEKYKNAGIAAMNELLELRGDPKPSPFEILRGAGFDPQVLGFDLDT